MQNTVLISLLYKNYKFNHFKSILIRQITTSNKFCKGGRNYYEILGVEQTCTNKAIRDAFIEKTKVHHPDRNEPIKSANQRSDDKEFKVILEAYQILSKKHSRDNYDLELKGIHDVHCVTRNVVHRPWESSTDKRYSPINNDSDEYYGVKGLRRVPNWKIVLACFIFCALGVAAQILAISKSVTFNREKLVERSTLYNSIHKQTREEALRNNNLSNLERVVNRMKESTER